MTVTVVVMILLGIAFVIASFIITEKLSSKDENYKVDLMTVDEDYQFSDRELQIIKRKIEDVIAKQAKDILYETNESLSNMANEKTMALGDYAVAVCDEIEKNHKEVMFLYSMLDDKQKEVMKTVKEVDDARISVKELLNESDEQTKHLEDIAKSIKDDELNSGNNKKNINDIVHNSVNQNYDETIQDYNKQNKNDAAHDKNDQKDIKNKNEEVFSSIEIDCNISEEDIKDIDQTSISDDLDNIDDIFAELDKTDINFDEVLESEFKDDSNANDIILEMYNSGRSVIEIAKELGLGVGEVKLVIDLYQGE